MNNRLFRECRPAKPVPLVPAETVFALAIEAFEHHCGGRFAEAITRYERALSLEPSLAIVRHGLGQALAGLGKHEAAIVEYRKAVETNPNYAEALCSWGLALSKLDRLDEAAVMFEQALTVDPRYAGAHFNLSVILKERGRIDEAWRNCKMAIRLAPRQTSYYRHLAEIRPLAAGDRHLKALERMAQESSGQTGPASSAAPLSPDDRIHLHFALAKAYQDTGRTERAFAQLIAGNRLKRQHTVYDETKMLSCIDRTRELFTSDFIAARQGGGEPSRLPIFVIGMPRSGTSLIEQILASHPDVSGAGEILLLDEIIRACGEPLPNAPRFPDIVQSLPAGQFSGIGATYVERLAKRAPGASRIVDKLPGNFTFAGMIHLALPNATIIHAVRDPVDTCLSCFSLLFTDLPQSYDLAELGRYYRHYRTLMEHWHRVLPPGRIIDVRYEDLVGDPEAEARRLIAHCGLAWDPRCLDFHRTDRTVRTASAVQVRRPIYKSSVGRWRNYEKFLEPLLAELESMEPSAPITKERRHA